MATVLRDRRQRTGRSLAEFSRKIGLHYSLACQIERGSMRVPQKWKAVIAEALGVSIEDLFDDRGFAKEEKKT